jgi:hypothetical protein
MPRRHVTNRTREASSPYPRQQPNDSTFVARPTRLHKLGRPKHRPMTVQRTFGCEKEKKRHHDSVRLPRVVAPYISPDFFELWSVHVISFSQVFPQRCRKFGAPKQSPFSYSVSLPTAPFLFPIACSTIIAEFDAKSNKRSPRSPLLR